VCRPVWVFSGSRRFAAKTPEYELGFPWISLESLVRIETYQWVTRDFQKKNFPPAFPSRKRRRNGGPKIWHAEGIDCSWGKFNLISDFLQEIAAWVVDQFEISR
jgi:hypothetical protein